MSRTAKLLIAPPKVKGNFWEKSVIFVTEDHEKGSIGLVLNKPSKMPIAEFSKQHGVESNVEGFIYVGGPVNCNALTVLHTPEWNCGNTLCINQDYSLSSSADLLIRFALDDRPKKWRMFAGLCAWAPEQLTYEINGERGYDHNNSWLITSSNYRTVFGLHNVDQWTTSIEQSGFEFVQNILA